MLKGVPGLFIAVGLGIVGAFCNWLYVAQLGKEMQPVEFIGINDSVKINPGDKFNRDQFVPISIPGNHLGNLDKSAYQWTDLATIVGSAATKSYGPGDILLRQDVRTPPEMDIKKLLSPDEGVLWIPVETRTSVPSLINAGDSVSFIVPRTGSPNPAPVAEDGPGAGRPAGTSETIGPFRVLALGNRLGSQDVLRAAGMSASQENIWGVAVKFVNKDFDEKGQKLLDTLRLTNFQQVQVILWPDAKAAK